MMLLGLYRGLTTAAEPLVRHYLRRRLRGGKEDPARFAERMGVPSRQRPSGPLVWIHAASVGESLSVLSLLERLTRERPRLSVLITTGTVTSARLLEQRLPESVLHQYVPVDRIAWVRRFLDHWRPDLALWVESEFWPNLLLELDRRKTPAVLLNARISNRSFARWRRFPGHARRILGSFAHCLAQTEDDAKRLRDLGACGVGCPGNLKFAAAPLPHDPAALADFHRAVGSRPVWLAASTHEGEEVMAGAAHLALRRRKSDLLTVIVPRHATRGGRIAEELAGQGLAVARRSTGERIGRDTEIYIADTMGELGLFYRAVPVALIGGSLVPHGGQNPLEAAQLDTALLFGPFMTNFQEIVDELDTAGAVATVANSVELADRVSGLLADPSDRSRRARAARDVARAKSGVLDAVMRDLKPYLDSIDRNVLEEKRHARA